MERETTVALCRCKEEKRTYGVCFACGKLSCFNTSLGDTFTCEWCGITGILKTVDSVGNQYGR